VLYLWDGIRNALPRSFALSHKQTKLSDDVWNHECPTDEAEEDDTWFEFMNEFEAFSLSYADLHIEIAPKVEVALLGRFTAEMLKRCDHRLAVAYATTLGEVTRGFQENLRDKLESVEAAESLGTEYGKWKAASLERMGDNEEGGESGPFLHASTESAVGSTVTEGTQASA
jgi:hypothetical protein